MRSITHPEAETRQHSKPPQPPPICHRCGALAPKRGRFTAPIEGVKKFICAACCSEIGSVAALVAHAEAAEREETRRRFTERRSTRPADRREAA